MSKQTNSQSNQTAKTSKFQQLFTPLNKREQQVISGGARRSSRGKLR